MLDKVARNIEDIAKYNLSKYHHNALRMENSFIIIYAQFYGAKYRVLSKVGRHIRPRTPLRNEDHIVIKLVEPRNLLCTKLDYGCKIRMTEGHFFSRTISNIKIIAFL